MSILLPVIGSAVLVYAGYTFFYIGFKLFQDRHELPGRMARSNLAYNPRISTMMVGLFLALGCAVLAIAALLWFSPLIAGLLALALIAILVLVGVARKQRQAF